MDKEENYKDKDLDSSCSGSEKDQDQEDDKNLCIKYEDDSTAKIDDTVTDSIKLYLNTCKIAQKEHCKNFDSLKFWKQNKEKFPALADLARTILGIPATSAMIEREFSKTGYIIRPHRRRLNCKLSELLFFLKCNNHLNDS
jgi:hypothetical protein